MRTPSRPLDGRSSLTLYQTEGCPSSRLVREVLCTLELPYLSVPLVCRGGKPSSRRGVVTVAASGWAGRNGDGIAKEWKEAPILRIDDDAADATTLVGAEECCEFLWERYADGGTGCGPSWLDPVPSPNVGREGSFAAGAVAAVQQGAGRFVPPEAMR